MVRPLEGGNTPIIIESWYQSIWALSELSKLVPQGENPGALLPFLVEILLAT